MNSNVNSNGGGLFGGKPLNPNSNDAGLFGGSSRPTGEERGLFGQPLN